MHWWSHKSKYSTAVRLSFFESNTCNALQAQPCRFSQHDCTLLPVIRMKEPKHSIGGECLHHPCEEFIEGQVFVESCMRSRMRPHLGCLPQTGVMSQWCCNRVHLPLHAYLLSAVDQLRLPRNTRRPRIKWRVTHHKVEAFPVVQFPMLVCTIRLPWRIHNLDVGWPWRCRYIRRSLTAYVAVDVKSDDLCCHRATMYSLTALHHHQREESRTCSNVSHAPWCRLRHLGGVGLSLMLIDQCPEENCVHGYFESGHRLT